ncbi:MAG: hypothetical protein ACPHGV_08140 [Synechococcus sp.]
MNNIPDAVSFKTLTTLLAQAELSPSPEQPVTGQAPVSTDWMQRVEQLLQEVEQTSEHAAAGRSSEQVMALGSFRTHLWLSLQALKASGLANP